MLIIVIAAAFNVATSLFVTVLQRFHDISIYKTLGMSYRDVSFLFISHGLIIGSIGIASGVLLGILLCEIFEWLQATYQFMPGMVYRMDNFTLELHGVDLLAIVVASFLICFISTIVPARRGARLKPVEGLRYE